MIDLVIVGAFYLALIIFLVKNRRRVEIIGKVVFLLKGRRGIKTFDKLAKIGWLWEIIFTIGAVFCIFLIFSGIYSMLAYFFLPTIMGVGSPQTAVFLIIPYKSTLLFSIILLLLVHEASHGIMARVKGVRIKSTGVGAFLFIPLAFVEVEDRDLEELRRLDRIKIFSAGSFTNILVYLILALIISSFLHPFLMKEMMEVKGVKISYVYGGTPAYESNLSAGMVIQEINGVKINNLSDFRMVMGKVGVGEEIELIADHKSFRIRTSPHPQNESKAYLGVGLSEEVGVREDAKAKYGIIGDFILWVYDFLLYSSTLNLLIGVVNLLPLFITDGSRLLYDFLDYLIKHAGVKRMVYNAINLLTVFLFASGAMNALFRGTFFLL
ncbi:MAG: site-2 protease family protein [Candidatus Nanoarchaeia archaeon]|nr:site-2 protease family protein [Candidatus Haiyanarchaeum thermophilum]MCW1302946.1 site-2 protease family protein [Candidatus Haiyanarchaeum thermophilum]MCW1303624.1 site-2 protease family protein [Candidatus Haiyanarchaeum thermophilum]MCW1306305.1 site-2 protease family protein [Candidatus Haiyanarchaeum thermophilum]MCW1307185.1 site-2 protease family protein [Candidatus Haiyanarchaeum thermophilum]